MAGTEGFEPPNARTKTWCLTAWPRPIDGLLAVRQNSSKYTTFDVSFLYLRTPLAKEASANKLMDFYDKYKNYKANRAGGD